MNELKQRLAALGLSEEMSAKVIATVADYAKTKVPASYHGMIDDALAGKSAGTSGLFGGLGDMFGKK